MKKAILFLIACTVSAAPVHLRCEYRNNPLGIDQRTPHLSWQSDNTERNWRQSAYQILVATNSKDLSLGKPDVWDSHKVSSDESIGIAYAGPKLESRKHYYWTVRVWDFAGKPSAWAPTASWEMGLLEPSDWQAKWITAQNPEDSADRAALQWIWQPGQDSSKVTPGTVATFRTNFDLSAKPTDAALLVLAKGDWQVKVNGSDAGSKTAWHSFDRRDITSQLIIGKNSVEITVTVPQPPQFGPGAGPPGTPQPAGLAALVKILQPDGKLLRLSDWQDAARVGPLDASVQIPQSASGFRHSFRITDRVTSARLYVTALGSYSAFLNGKPIGDSHLTPGWTDFSKHIQYQVYDVIDLLTNGENTLAALLGDGWFASPLTWIGDTYAFGKPPRRIIGQLEIQYATGKHSIIATDESWKTAPTGILNSEIYKGEQYDARLEPQGWKQAHFNDSKWSLAINSDAPTGQLVAQVDSPIKTIQTVKPETINSPAPGVYIFDMGQNLAGKAVLKAHGPTGTRVQLRFAEILNPDGTIYTKNLRNADATNVFVLRGTGEESFRPEFTFQGFRYVEVTGYPGKPTLESLSAEVISSLADEPTATIVTANPTVNQMWKLGIWGQRSNFISIPTDCPQRDERLGWTGDAGVFWRTGSYNFNIAPFTHKWMQDMRDGQDSEGAFPNVAPNVLASFGHGAPGWGDAGVIVPWTTWMQYGDRTVIDENWEAMERWMNFILKANPDFIRKNQTGADFADWLAPDPNTPKDLVDTAYWALVAKMMTEMAKAVGKEDDAQKYLALFGNINQAFQKTYVKDDGTVGAGTQTGYVVALHAGLYPKNLDSALTNNLVAAIEKNGGHLSTGFLGTPFLLFALSDHGRADVAYKLLLNDSYPSWGYMIKKGATTWWERWNGDTGDPAMNSYNHYSFGSVVAWLYRSVGGIDTTNTGPGFHEIVIHPHPSEQLTHARAEYDSMYGKISTEWNSTQLKVTIPANTHAHVFLPSGKVEEIGSGIYDFKLTP